MYVLILLFRNIIKYLYNMDDVIFILLFISRKFTTKSQLISHAKQLSNSL